MTPHHVAELFTDLAEVNRDSIVYDNCCGTGGLLVAAMDVMVRDAGADKALVRKIKKEHLFGIEYQTKIYALAVSTMILHDDSTNILRGDCLEIGTQLILPHKPNVGVLNPSYKNKKGKREKKKSKDKEELEYVFDNLECLTQNGTCVAIVPIGCAIGSSGAVAEWKRKLLEKHTLEAVMSMPIDLFHNSDAGVVTSVMVFTAHRPHPRGKKT
jgi:type I restriction enzyme M protein